GRDVVIVARHVDHAKALAGQPVPDGVHVGLGWRVLPVELCRGQELTGRGTARVRNGQRQRLEVGLVVPTEIDAEADVVARIRGLLEARRLCPRWYRPRHRRATGRGPGWRHQHTAGNEYRQKNEPVSMKSSHRPTILCRAAELPAPAAGGTWS